MCRAIDDAHSKGLAGVQATPEALPASARESLVEFLRHHRARALAEWERAIQVIPAAAILDQDELRDHMPLLIERVLAVVSKSHPVTELGDLPEQHAMERLHEGFNLEQVAWEYSALRSTLLRLNEEAETKLEPAAIVLLNDATARRDRACSGSRCSRRAPRGRCRGRGRPVR